VGWVLARAAAKLVPADSLLVPLPRASSRTIGYGIDPARDLARRIATLTDLEVWPGLLAPLLHRRQAGRSRSERNPPIFRLMEHPPAGRLVLIDDVITTGRTLQQAQATLQEWAGRVMLAVTATATND